MRNAHPGHASRSVTRSVAPSACTLTIFSNRHPCTCTTIMTTYRLLVPTPPVPPLLLLLLPEAVVAVQHVLAYTPSGITGSSGCKQREINVSTVQKTSEIAPAKLLPTRLMLTMGSSWSSSACPPCFLLPYSPPVPVPLLILGCRICWAKFFALCSYRSRNSYTIIPS